MPVQTFTKCHSSLGETRVNNDATLINTARDKGGHKNNIAMAAYLKDIHLTIALSLLWSALHALIARSFCPNEVCPATTPPPPVRTGTTLQRNKHWTRQAVRPTHSGTVTAYVLLTTPHHLIPLTRRSNRVSRAGRTGRTIGFRLEVDVKVNRFVGPIITTASKIYWFQMTPGGSAVKLLCNHKSRRSVCGDRKPTSRSATTLLIFMYN